MASDRFRSLHVRPTSAQPLPPVSPWRVFPRTAAARARLTASQRRPVGEQAGRSEPPTAPVERS
jgi:hypothetical protein